ncbi:MAG: redoxin domain-containing protein [Acidimicrobiia bacterium]|nr:redoxin domain-containing protein [Acidimicrobiia bacterium]
MRLKSPSPISSSSLLAFAFFLAIVVSACGTTGDPEAVPLLPEIDPASMQQLLADSDKPLLVNVWASWCIPCRSEAPLLRQAHQEFGDRVTFIGVDISDSQNNARAFLDEFQLTGFDHYFDRSGAVPAALGGNGVPLTFFYAPGGELVELHFGVIDERALAFNLDEIIRRS